MDFQEQQLAQIVRDFMEAYALASRIGERLSEQDLEFHEVQRLVGDSEESALYRLKEETHALFRFDETSSAQGLQAEELFDLSVGALFHEAMKFREGYYLTATYRPRLEQMIAEGRAAGHLLQGFLRVLEAGQQRMSESAQESRELFNETRDQLLALLEQIAPNSAIARSLVDDPVRTEQVFNTSLEALLESVFGSAERGYQLALEGLIASGHYTEAVQLLERGELRKLDGFCTAARHFARGMERHYEGDAQATLQHFSRWVEHGRMGADVWVPTALRVLTKIAASADLELLEPARALRDRIEFGRSR